MENALPVFESGLCVAHAANRSHPNRLRRHFLPPCSSLRLAHVTQEHGSSLVAAGMNRFMVTNDQLYEAEQQKGVRSPTPTSRSSLSFFHPLPIG